jgi:ATP-dependent Clp protease ATP-binding subunit ClpC
MDGLSRELDALTEPGRRVVALAHEEAVLLYHNYLGTEHLLLGILREGESIAARVLGAAGLSLDDARGELEAIIGRGRSAPTEAAQPMTPRAKMVLGTCRPAAEAGQIGPEHILLGMVHDGDGVGVEILTRRGIDLDDLQQRLR